jgi:hypothetical protein
MRKKNIFYKDPLDQWLEDHPFLTTIIVAVAVWLFIVCLTMLAWSV